MTNVEQYINEYANEIADWIINWLENNDKKATGKTIASIEVEQVSEYIVNIIGQKSVRWALMGRGAGTPPPIEKIKSWIEAKGITPYPDDNGNIPTINSLAFLISRSIGEHGTLPPKLKEENINMVIQMKGVKLSEQIGEDYSYEITNKIKEIYS